MQNMFALQNAMRNRPNMGRPMNSSMGAADPRMTMGQAQAQPMNSSMGNADPRMAMANLMGGGANTGNQQMQGQAMRGPDPQQLMAILQRLQGMQQGQQMPPRNLMPRGLLR